VKWRAALVGLILSTVSTAGIAASAPVTLYVAPDGSDQWSGRFPAADAAKADGPLATPFGARFA